MPENTDNYEGFFHLEEIKGNVTHASMKYLIRDFNTTIFNHRKEQLTKIVEKLNRKYGNCIELKIVDTYNNMFEEINKHPNFLKNTLEAFKISGIPAEVYRYEEARMEQILLQKAFLVLILAQVDITFIVFMNIFV